MIPLLLGSFPLASRDTPAPDVVLPMTGPPACRYTDLLAAHRGYGEWQRTLLDTIYRLNSGYAPGDLVSVSRAGLSGSGSVRSLVITDLKALLTAARNAGVRLRAVSTYRSYSRQQSTFNYWVSVAGYSRALLCSARPGHSEHQLGTTVDFARYGGPDPWNVGDWAATKEGSWMARNAWRYGFVMSYPRGRSPSVTCYKYEPWHFRYFGRTVAKAIHDSGLTSREYLWPRQ